MTGPKGVGMWIWLIDSCENGDVEAIAKKAVEYGITWVAPKAQQGTVWYARNRAKIKSLSQALHDNGVEIYPWGWIYGRSTYGSHPSIARAEGERAFEVIHELAADGYIVDAELDWKRPLNMAAEASKFMAPLEDLSIPVLVSSYRYPNYHRAFPWAAWNATLQPDRGDGWVPQVYWEQDSRLMAGSIQLQQTLDQYKAWGLLSGGRSFHPAPAAYSRGTWNATSDQILHFTNKVEELSIPTYIPWSWQHMGTERWTGLAQDWYEPEGMLVTPPPPPSPAPSPPSDENGNGELPVGAVKQVEVTALGLNVRWGPNTANGKATSPLVRRERVFVYNIQDYWGRIDPNYCHWIHLGYTKDI